MTSISRLAVAAAVVGALAACASVPPSPPAPTASAEPAANWRKLVDGARGLANFDRVGAADWQAVDGAIQATRGSTEYAYLVTRTSYRDFVVRAEFWVSDDANTGIFFRCQEPTRINDENCYEANVFDQRADPSFGTGAITKIAKAEHAQKAGGKWNTYEITARGKRLTLVLNGVKTVDVEDGRFAEGPIALQWGRGTVRFRKVEVRPL